MVPFANAACALAVRIFVATGSSPAELCRELNNFVGHRGISSRFITFFIAKIDRKRGTLTYSNAGHNPPILARKARPQVLLSEGGLVLGVLPDRQYRQVEIPLEPGDTLVLYTDGLTEARNRSGQEFGEQRVVDVIASKGGTPAGSLKESLIEAVQQFKDGSFQDDLTLVVLSLHDATLP